MSEKDIRRKFNEAEDVDPNPELEPQDDGNNDSPTRNDKAPGLEVEGAKLPTNDTGNGGRFKLYFGENVIHVPRVGFHLWDGKRYLEDPDDIQIRQMAQRIQHRIIEEIPHVALEDWQLREIAGEAKVRLEVADIEAIAKEGRTPDQVIKLEDLHQKLVWIRKLKEQKSSLKSLHRSFAKTSGNTGRIDAMLKEAAVNLSRDLDDLDADPLTLNTETGLLRFTVTDPGDGASKVADFRLDPHEREVTIPGRNRAQIITKMMPVDYDPDARCPTFDAFLARTQPDQEIRSFLQRWFGLSITGLLYQGFAFLYGDGANGKSVLVKLMARIAGDYAAKAKIESITGHNRRGGGDATPDLMGLIGARFAHAAEPEEGQKLQEAIIKELTGGESMLMRKLHSDFIEVWPNFKLTISGNHKPEIRGTDGGIWRRVKLVPFDVQIPEAERDEALGDKLWEERSGILNWLIDGLLDYLEGGLQEPKKVTEATNEYRSESDPIGTFLRECCTVDAQTPYMDARTLIDGFNFFQLSNGEPRWERKASLAFKKLVGRYKDPKTGFTYESVKRTKLGYSGIRFTEEFQKLLSQAVLDRDGRPIPGKGADDE